MCIYHVGFGDCPRQSFCSCNGGTVATQCLAKLILAFTLKPNSQKKQRFSTCSNKRCRRPCRKRRAWAIHATWTHTAIQLRTFTIPQRRLFQDPSGIKTCQNIYWSTVKFEQKINLKMTISYCTSWRTPIRPCICIGLPQYLLKHKVEYHTLKKVITWSLHTNIFLDVILCTAARWVTNFLTICRTHAAMAMQTQTRPVPAKTLQNRTNFDKTVN